MGCTSFSKPVLINELGAPCKMIKPGQVPNEFPPSGLIHKDDALYFNTRELFKQSQIAIVQSIVVVHDEFIRGFELEYSLDGKKVHIKLLRNDNGQKKKLSLKNSDLIVKCVASFNEDFLCSVKFVSKEGQVLEAVGKKGTGANQTELEFADDGLIGLKGICNDYCTALYLHTWKQVRFNHR